jgi:2-polyprenyl-3-methyl-5-hydroxy-6-metoxy-1,4-benzoquinol methylase
MSVAVSLATSARCPFCSASDRVWLRVPCDWRRSADRSDYAIYWCDACQYGLVSPRPEPEEIPAFYDLTSYYTHGESASAAARESDRFWDKLRVNLAWRADRGIPLNGQRVLALLAPGREVCDIGCGDGSLLLDMQQSGLRVTGVEIDPAARRTAQSKGLGVFEGTAEDLPDAVRDRRFDLVVMSHVLEHCLEPQLSVTNAAGLLNDGGQLVIEVPNHQSFGAAMAGTAWPWLDVPRHLNFFTARSLEQVCSQAGLEVATIEFSGYTRQFKREWLETEQTIRTACAAVATSPAPRRSARLDAWKLLAATAFVPARYKYDSVRLIARKAAC